MKYHPRKLILLITLGISVNLSLYYVHSRKQQYLEEAQALLAADSVMEEFFFYEAREISRYCRDTAYLQDPQLALSLGSFHDAIDQVDSVRKKFLLSSARNFFADQISVEQKLINDLFQSYTRLSSAMNTHLTAALSKKFYQQARDKTIFEFEKMNLEMERASVGTTREYQFPLAMTDTTFFLRVSALKAKTKIEWSEGYQVIPSYLEKIDFLIADTQSSQLREKLVKIDSIFSLSGYVRVYNASYDLKSLTPAELNDVVKFLRLLEIQIGNIVMKPELDLYYD